MFATDGSEKDPVAVYKFFSEKRPREMKYDDAPFYLSVNNFKATDSAETSTKAWFKSSAVGASKLNSLVKSMAAKAGIENSRLRNHSGRKAIVQRLSESDVPPTHIAQLSGHKNLKSIQNYSSVSTNQQMHMSKLLSGLVAGNSPSSSTKAAACSSPLSAQKQGMDLFSGAVIQGGNFSININTLNQ